MQISKNAIVPIDYSFYEIGDFFQIVQKVDIKIKNSISIFQRKLFLEPVISYIKKENLKNFIENQNVKEYKIRFIKNSDFEKIISGKTNYFSFKLYNEDLSYFTYNSEKSLFCSKKYKKCLVPIIYTVSKNNDILSYELQHAINRSKKYILTDKD